jgi:hypothetical protein
VEGAEYVRTHGAGRAGGVSDIYIYIYIYMLEMRIEDLKKTT